MAPEILETRTPDGRDHNYDPAMADVYAAGIMLLAMLVGAFPYDHASGSDIVTAEREVW